MKGKIAHLITLMKEAAALLIDGELHDFAEPGANAPGSIFKVKVKHQIKGSGGIFVESPDGDFFGIKRRNNAGDVILVQVSSYGDEENFLALQQNYFLKVDM